MVYIYTSTIIYVGIYSKTFVQSYHFRMERLYYTLLLLSYSAQACVWNLNTDIPIKDPLYLIDGYEVNLKIPETGGLTLSINENMVLSCPGKSNTINGTNIQEITVKCTTNNQVLFDNQAYHLKDLACVNSPASNLLFTGMSCANGMGEIFKIQFTTNREMAFLYDVCYDRVNEANLYSVHILYGKAIKGAEIDSDRPSFRTPGLTYGTTTANQYKQTEQMKRFTALLGLSQAEKYITTSSYLARGHLAPDADFLFGTWSFATYFFVNVAPEWQVVNAGNWLRVEDMSRDIADKRQENLTIFTGTYGVLQLNDDGGQMVDIYLLPEKKLPVPKWYWKIIYSSLTNEGIALITLNNPHVQSINNDELFCENICTSTNWYRVEWNQFDKGFTFCCNVTEFLSVVNTVPYMKISNNLKGPL